MKNQETKSRQDGLQHQTIQTKSKPPSWTWQAGYLLLVRQFGEFSPLRNVPFTWFNMQEVLVCKRLDGLLSNAEWDSRFPNIVQGDVA